MKPLATIPLLAACAALAACGPARERSFNEIWDQTNGAIVNTAVDIERQTENELRLKEQALDEQANAQLNSLDAAAANAVGNESANSQ